MKFLTCFALIAVFVTVATAAAVGTSQQVVAQNFLQTLSEEGSLNAPASELARLKKSAYGGSAAPSIPAPACPKNYLFSCQPNLAPVPCASAPAAPNYSGSYSAPVPTYAFPRNHPGIAPELLRNYYY